MPPNGNKETSDPALALAEFVRRRRKANRMTQGDLALLAGVGRRFVSDLENGKQSLVLDKVNLVLKVFGQRLGPVDRERETHTPGLTVDRIYTPRSEPAAESTKPARRKKRGRHG